MYNLHLLGAPTLTQNGDPIYIRRRRSIALLAYLATQQRPQSREHLATLFWGEQSQPDALANLRRELRRLKTDLDNALIVSDRKTLGIDAEAELWVDVQAFAQACEAEEWETAVSLHTTQFMEGFTLPNSPAFDEWQYFQREQLRDRFANALQTLIAQQEADGAFEPAIGYARRWLLLDTLHEPAHRTLMRLYAKAGQFAAAVRQYHICEQTLQTELDVEPEAETKELLTAVQNKTFTPTYPAPIPNPQSPVPDPRSPIPNRHHNLPTFADAFIGRQEEIDAIVHQLTETGCRLLTLLGMGGIGKTRLAVEVMRHLLDADTFANGLFFIDLAGVESAQDVLPHVAKTLNIPLLKASEPLAQLVSRIGRQQMLLTFDNFEHVQSAASTLTDLLQQCPNLSILVTSRHQLNLKGERVHHVSGLPTLETRQASEATALFDARAQQFSSDLDVVRERPFTHAICHIVEGMPLAIELCAAWVQTLTVQEILAEIQRGIDILESNSADTPDRHRSIRTVFQTSFSLLTLAEQTVLLKLTPFRGSFSREAAEQVADATLRYLRVLVQKSLLGSYRDGAETRYRLHPLLRQFLLAQIDADTLAQNQQRHSRYFAVYMAQIEQKKCTPQNQEIESIVFTEVDNLRAVWRSLGRQIAQNQPSEPICQHIDQLLLAWHYAYLHRNQFLEGIQLLETVYQPMVAQEWLESGTTQQQITAAKIATISAIYRFNANQLEQAMGMSEAVTAVFQAHPTPPYDAYALHTWGLAASRYGNKPLAREKLEASIAIATDDSFTPFTISGLGGTYFRDGEYETAVIYYRQALALAKKSHEQMGVYMGHLTLGGYHRAVGDAKTAIEHFDTVNRLASQPGKEAYRIASLTHMATCYETMNRPDKAAKQHEQALQIARRVGREDWIGTVSRRIGRLQLDLGNITQAQEAIQTGLETSIALNVPTQIVESLLATALVQAQYGRFHEALVLSGFVMSSDLADAALQQEAADFWEELISELPQPYRERAEAVLETAVLDDILALVPTPPPGKQ